MNKDINIKKRNAILGEHRKIILQMRDLEKQISVLAKKSDPQWRTLEEKRNDLYRQIEPLIEAYWEWIPSIKLSVCPICKRDVYRRFDPVDCHGFWWMHRTQRPVDEPKVCEHLCLITGALDRQGKPYEKTLFESNVGPENPFVIPRILEMPTMQAVVSFVDLECGYRAFPICYFAKKRPKQSQLTQGWTKREFHFIREDGRSGWNITEEDYDFDLAPWIESGRLNKLA